MGEAIPQLRRLVTTFSSGRPVFDPRSGHVMDKVAMGQVFSECFCFACELSFHRLLHIHHHLSYEAGTIYQLMADVLSGLRLTSPKQTKTYGGVEV
jgi:hypothetical protein